MRIGRVKTIVIIILAVLNACFAVMIVFDFYDAARVQNREREEMSEFFAANGISLPPEIIPASGTAHRYSVGRDTQQEQRLVTQLLGAAQAAEQGGGITLYENENGSALFRSNGEFEIRINRLDDSLGAGRTLEALLEQMDISYSDRDAAMEEHGDSRSISYFCTWNGKELLNCRVTLRIYAGGRAILSGRRLHGSPQREGDTDSLEVNTVLVRFLDEIRTGGHVCNGVTQIELAYQMNASSSGMQLEPVWRIATDGGEYRVSAVTGRLTS